MTARGTPPGTRRGRYDKRSTVPVTAELAAEDHAWCERIKADSPLASDATKAALAESAASLRALIRSLRARPEINSDEARTLATASSSLRRTLESLKLTDKLAEVDDDL